MALWIVERTRLAWLAWFLMKYYLGLGYLDWVPQFLLQCLLLVYNLGYGTARLAFHFLCFLLHYPGLDTMLLSVSKWFWNMMDTCEDAVVRAVINVSDLEYSHDFL